MCLNASLDEADWYLFQRADPPAVDDLTLDNDDNRRRRRQAVVWWRIGRAVDLSHQQQQRRPSSLL
jgi:hypothetical protein